jgi:hypothetical protein
MLGIGILIIGLILGIYSVTTFVEVKNLSEKVDLELIDSDTKLTSTDKFYEYQSIAEFLNKKLNQNKGIPIKNTSCVYLDYAHQNAILMYNLADRRLDADPTKKNQAATNIRSLYKMYDNYKGCRQSAGLKEELSKYIADIDKSLNGSDREERMNNFLNGYNEKKQQETQSYDYQNTQYDDGMTEEQRRQFEQDMNNVQQWQDEPQTQERQHVLVPMED